MRSFFRQPRDDDSVALCVCWLASLGTAAAIVDRFEWKSLWLSGAGLIWACSSLWLQIKRWRLPILGSLSQRRSAKSSALAGPILRASLVLFSQAFLLSFVD